MPKRVALTVATRDNGSAVCVKRLRAQHSALEGITATRHVLTVFRDDMLYYC